MTDASAVATDVSASAETVSVDVAPPSVEPVVVETAVASEPDVPNDPVPPPIPPPIVEQVSETPPALAPEIVAPIISEPAPPVSPEASRGGQASLASPASQGGQAAPAQQPEQIQQPQSASQPTQSAPQPQFAIKNYFGAAIEKIRFKKRAKLDKIVELARKRTKITNDDVQIHVHVSHATATRYLHDLVLQGRLTLKGPLHGAWYEAANR